MSKTAAFSEVMTAAEAAKYLRVSKATILRLARKGPALGVRIGRQWRFSRQVILRAMREKP